MILREADSIPNLAILALDWEGCFWVWPRRTTRFDELSQPLYDLEAIELFSRRVGVRFQSDGGAAHLPAIKRRVLNPLAKRAVVPQRPGKSDTPHLRFRRRIREISFSWLSTIADNLKVIYFTIRRMIHAIGEEQNHEHSLCALLLARDRDDFDVVIDIFEENKCLIRAAIRGLP